MNEMPLGLWAWLITLSVLLLGVAAIMIWDSWARASKVIADSRLDDATKLRCRIIGFVEAGQFKTTMDNAVVYVDELLQVIKR